MEFDGQQKETIKDHKTSSPVKEKDMQPNQKGKHDTNFNEGHYSSSTRVEIPVEDFSMNHDSWEINFEI